MSSTDIQGVELTQIPHEEQQKINIAYETQCGNLSPQFIAIEQKMIQVEELDQFGYNIFHHSVSYNKFSGVVPLVEKFKVNIDTRSVSLQTPLMIAANYGYVKMAKYLLEKGADINAKDDNDFSPFLYAIKNKQNTMTLFLLANKADIRGIDINGCNCLHWSAYTDNLFMFKLFEKFGMDVEVRDKNGYTPFIRAIFNESYDCIRYMLDKYPMIIPENLNTDKLQSQSIKKMIIEQKKYLKLKNTFPFCHYYENRKMCTQLFIIISIVIIYYSFKACIFKLNDNGIQYYLNIFFNILVFIYIPIHFKFIQSTDNQQIKLDKQELTDYQCPQFERINQLLSIENENEQGMDQRLNLQTIGGHSMTFFHKIIKMILESKFDDISQINYKNLCVSCMKFRNDREHHCDKCDNCVYLFNHHSNNYERCISRYNHKFYYFLIALQQLGLFLYFLLYLIGYWYDLTSYRIFFLVEIPYQIRMSQKQDAFVLFGFVWAFFLLVQNSFDFLVETHGIIFNMTRFEIFNRFSCPYYFQNIYKGDVQSGSTYFRYYKNPFNKGIVRNIKYYLQDTFNTSE